MIQDPEMPPEFSRALKRIREAGVEWRAGRITMQQAIVRVEAALREEGVGSPAKRHAAILSLTAYSKQQGVLK